MKNEDAAGRPGDGAVVLEVMSLWFRADGVVRWGIRKKETSYGDRFRLWNAQRF